VNLCISPSLAHYSPGARLFLGMAIGDAFGARFENNTRDIISLIGEEETYRDANRYTDDTQMAIGIADLLISEDIFTAENLAQSLMAAYHRDPRCGYSHLTKTMLENSANAQEFLRTLSERERTQRKSDGAAMRALPIGFLNKTNEVIRYASQSANITHAHPDALAATVGIALIAHDRYHHHKKFQEIIVTLPEKIPYLTTPARNYLDNIIHNKWNPEIILGKYLNYGVPYTESIILLGAVMALLTEFGEYPHQALLESVKLGGDTDTTACIVLGASLLYPSNPLPDTLILGLENGIFGIEYLIRLGNELGKKFPPANNN